MSGGRLSMLFIGWAALFACDSCRERREPTRTPNSAGSIEIVPGALPPPWSPTLVDRPESAVPQGCRLLTRPILFATPTAQLRFLASPGDLTHLAIARGSTEAATDQRGLISFVEEGASKAHDMPWLRISEPPVAASASGRWLAVLPQMESDSTRVRLWLWREGLGVRLLAEGDELRAIDARCSGADCAILTTLPAQVAAPGAAVWLGRPFDGLETPLQRVDVMGPSVKIGSEPLRIIGMDAAVSRVTVVFDAGSQARVVTATPGDMKAIASIPTVDGLLDAGMVGVGLPVGVAVQKRSDQACAPASLLVTPAGQLPAEIPLTALPTGADVAKSGSGLLLTWIAPVNCRDSGRKVVHGVLIDDQGHVAGSPMAIRNAHGYAVATSGSEMSIWLAHDGGVEWLRASCGSPSIPIAPAPRPSH